MAEDDKSTDTTTDTGSTAGTDTASAKDTATGTSTSSSDEQLGENGLKALQAERAARAAAEKERDAHAARLKEIDDREKSEAQLAIERAEAAEKERDTARSELLRSQVVTAKKLPPGLAARLRGNTREELEADADQLLEDLKAAGGTTAGAGDGDQGARGAASTGEPTVEDYVGRFNKTK